MTDYAYMARRLRDYNDCPDGVVDDAADAIETLLRERDEARAAQGKADARAAKLQAILEGSDADNDLTHPKPASEWKRMWGVMLKERDASRAWSARYHAYARQLRSDQSLFDATDAAHPAWWRGHDYVAAQYQTRLDEARAEVARLRAALDAIVASGLPDYLRAALAEKGGE